MTNELAIASAEINDILQYLSDEQVNKIPKEMRLFLEEKADKNYISHINPNKRIIDQDITSKTKDILVVFYRNYWGNDEKRKEVNEILMENEQKHQEELRKKYNPDDVFKNEIKPISYEKHESNQLEIVKYKNENIFVKIINKIKMIFKK